LLDNKPTGWYIIEMGRPSKTANTKSSKEKLIEGAFSIIRAKGYSATTVDDLCAFAGVTKGTFFHYFESKEALAVAAAENWSAVTNGFFRTASYHDHANPVDRVLGYIDFRKEILTGSIAEFTCLIGTMVQETYQSNPKIRDACYASIFGHSKGLEDDIQSAKKLYAPQAKWTVKTLALHTQAVIQGAFILAKASQDPQAAADSLDHLKNYVRLLFNHKTRQLEPEIN
jgi:TetR/AcrR family transcriptional repressor of nem operon